MTKGFKTRTAATFLIAASLLCGALALRASDSDGGRLKASLVLAQGSSLRLEGDSTLHSYASTATKISVVGEIEGATIGEKSLIDSALQGALKRLTVSIPVRDMKSGKSGLDKNMVQALKAGEYPEIVFRLKTYALAPHPAKPGVFQMKAAGSLVVAGKENPVELEAEIGPADRRLRVRGSKELLMTDFGIKPPTMFLGALKTDDRVVVHYDLVLGLEDEPGTQTRRQP